MMELGNSYEIEDQINLIVQDLQMQNKWADLAIIRVNPSTLKYFNRMEHFLLI